MIDEAGSRAARLQRWSTAWQLSHAATRDVARWNLLGRAWRWFAMQRLKRVSSDAYSLAEKLRREKADAS